MRTAIFAAALAAFVILPGSSILPGAAETGVQKIVFARPFPNVGQIGLYTAAANGSDERPLLPVRDWDYDATWSPTAPPSSSPRSARARRISIACRPDGAALERLTDSPAYDDQAAFSPDGKQLVFVSTRAGGTADLWTLDLQTRRAKAADLRDLVATSGRRGRPTANGSRSRPIAAATCRAGHGRWEHLQLADLYVMHPDGSRAEADHRARRLLRQPEVDDRQPARDRVLHDCGADARRTAGRVRKPGNDTRLVSFDIETNASADLPAGPGVKFNPFLPSDRPSATSARTRRPPVCTTRTARTGPKGNVRAAAWSPDGNARRVSSPRDGSTDAWVKTFSRNPRTS